MTEAPDAGVGVIAGGVTAAWSAGPPSAAKAVAECQKLPACGLHERSGDWEVQGARGSHTHVEQVMALSATIDPAGGRLASSVSRCCSLSDVASTLWI